MDDKALFLLLAPLLLSVIGLVWIFMLMRSGRPFKLSIAGLGLSIAFETNIRGGMNNDDLPHPGVEEN